MQNCNVPPDAMMEGSPFRLERTIPYLYADLTQQQTYGYPEQGRVDQFAGRPGRGAAEGRAPDDGRERPWPSPTTSARSAHPAGWRC